MTTKTFATRATATRALKRDHSVDTHEIVAEGERFAIAAKVVAPRVVLKALPTVASTVASPFEKCRQFIHANIGVLTRKEIIVALVGMGINRNTAQTRYALIRQGKELSCRVPAASE